MPLPLLVCLSVGVLILSIGTIVGTFFSMLYRANREKKLAKNVFYLRKNLKRRIFHLAADEVEENVLHKTVSTMQGWVSNTKTIGADKQASHVEAKKLMRKADVHISRNELDVGEKHLIEALSLDENNKDINKKLALIYLRQEKYPKAELIYLKLIEQGTKDPSVFSNVGLILYHQGRHDMAIKSYLRAIELDSKRSARYANVGQIYYELKDTNNAIIYFEKASLLDSRNTDYLFILAKLYEEKSIKEKAKYFYHKILDIEPYNEEARNSIKKLI